MSLRSPPAYVFGSVVIKGQGGFAEKAHEIARWFG